MRHGFNVGMFIMKTEVCNLSLQKCFIYFYAFGLLFVTRFPFVSVDSFCKSDQKETYQLRIVLLFISAELTNTVISKIMKCVLKDYQTTLLFLCIFVTVSSSVIRNTTQNYTYK